MLTFWPFDPKNNRLLYYDKLYHVVKFHEDRLKIVICRRQTEKDKQNNKINWPTYLKNLRFSQVTNTQTKLEGHSVECIPPPRNAWSTRTYRDQYIFEISFCISFLAQSLNGEESLKKNNKNSRLQIRIRIFTKIESVGPCHTPNLSAKFHPNPSTTFWDILHTNKQTDREEWKHNLLPPSVVEVIIRITTI